MKYFFTYHLQNYKYKFTLRNYFCCSFYNVHNIIYIKCLNRSPIDCKRVQASPSRNHVTLQQLKIGLILPPRFFIQRLHMTRQYYFLVALLMTDYQIIERRLLAVCAQERSMPRYKRNKNKVTSLRIRSRAPLSLAAKAIFFLHSQCRSAVRYRETARNYETLELIVSREDAIDTRTLNPCSLFRSRISRRVLMPNFIRGNIISES